MTIQQLKNKGWIIYEVIVGSHAYGTNIEGSDVDIKGIFIQPTEEILRGNRIEQISDETNDTVYYEIERFFELLQKSNPNIQEILYVPERCVLNRTGIFDTIFDDVLRETLITKKMAKTFVGFAKSQVKKARGLNKKMNWEQERMERKTPLDFCYVLVGKERSMKFHSWVTNQEVLAYRKFIKADEISNQTNTSLAKVNNAPDLYSMYYDPKGPGMVSKDGKQIITANIPKECSFLGYVRYDQNAYSTHCKDYNSYETWLKERNELRYNINKAHGKNYDTKNMMHCIRILEMAHDIAEGRGLVVERPNAEYLIDIRMGKWSYEDVVEHAENLISSLEGIFDIAPIPDEVDSELMKDVLLETRLDNLIPRII